MTESGSVADHHIAGHCTGGAVSIHNPGVNLWLLPGLPVTGIAGELARIAPEWSWRVQSVPDSDVLCSHLHRNLPRGLGEHFAAGLLERLRASVEVMMITGATQVHAQLEVFFQPMCTLFHCDANIFRLLLTIDGAGTEWVSNDQVNREAVRQHLPDRILPGATIQKIPAGMIALLKGDKYPDHNEGLLHRSPVHDDSGYPRLVLRMDPLFGSKTKVID